MSATPVTRPSLLLRVRDADDSVAWQQFVALYTPLIFNFCRARGLQEADAADVAQEVMRAVARSVSKFEYNPELGTFRSWLFRLTRNKFNNHLEKLHRQPQGTGETVVQEFLEAQACPEKDNSWDVEFYQRVFEWGCQQIQSEFSESTWQAFWRTSVLEQSGEEVAEALGLSVGAVYIAKSRVRFRLREVMAGATNETS